VSPPDPDDPSPGIAEGNLHHHPPDGDGSGPGLDVILEEIDTVVEPIHEAVSSAPAVGIAVAGGPMITLPEEGPDVRASTGADSVRSGLNQAGPVAIAGLVVNAAGALVVVAVARLVTSQAYGDIAQLLGLFFILSMPGSAILVGVVRRVTALQTSGQGHLVRHWIAKVHRIALAAIAVEVVLVVALQGWIAHQLSLPNSQGIVLILVAAGIWILLSVDRGLLQAHRSYRALAGNLFMEGAVRTVFVIGLVSLHMGVAGYALGIFISEVVATAHAHWLASRAWRSPDDLPAHKGLATLPENILARRKLLADVSAAFVGLALLGLLQNVDVILLGRLDHANVGPYAAISVASKAMVFGALALGAYLLPEATIRWNEGGHAVRQLGVTLIFLAVPAAVLLGIAVFIPKWFLTVIFSARLSSAAPSFATLVAAMICLSFSVLITNYLFGTGSRWIVLLLFAGSALAVGLVAAANGQIGATARADLVVQGALALGMGLAFVAIHVKHRGRHWIPWGGRSTGRPAAPR
jgi:O-antigen/teichoic acid export membrane protein